MIRMSQSQSDPQSSAPEAATVAPTVNEGDRVKGPQSAQEKSQQVAVDAGDVTGEHVVVPTYVEVKTEEGESKQLHHVKDAEEISDVIRQARVDEEGDRKW